LARNRKIHSHAGGNGKGGAHNRSDEKLFTDLRKLGTMASRKNKMLSDVDIAQIRQAYHSWRNIDDNYSDLQGFCKSASITEVEANNYELTPGRYVDTEEVENDGIPYKEKAFAISQNLNGYFKQSINFQKRMKSNFKKVGIKIQSTKGLQFIF
jgi:type I restriction enzyme M protein